MKNLTQLNKANFLLFDMDGTLIDTDYANFLAYKYAIDVVLNKKVNLEFNPDIRFTKSILRKFFVDIDFEAVITLKNRVFSKFLHYTKINQSVLDVIKNKKNKKVILVTNSSITRAKMTLAYHNLISEFDGMFFNTDTNKYQYVLNNINDDSVFVFENEAKEIQNAVDAGIRRNKILKI